MPRPRFQSLPPERQHAILDVAARHFSAQGFAAASLNAILAEAGVSKGVAYYYFDGKGDLFATVVESAWEDLQRALWPHAAFDPDALQGEAFWPELEQIYRRQIAVLVQKPHVWRVVKATPEALGEAGVARLAPRIEGLMAELHRLLHRAQQDGQIRDDLPSELLIAMVSGLDDAIDGWFLAHPDALRDHPELPARTFQALRRLLSPTPR